MVREKVIGKRNKILKMPQKARGYGKDNPSWKGGITKAMGYWLIHGSLLTLQEQKQLRTIINYDGYIKKSNLIWFRNKGEIIKKPYFLHHKDDNKLNDDIKNLHKTNRSEHINLHRK